ncbi:MAG: PAS domain S-box protein [Burkholderiales bacterium]|nr:MAG: PAS domain S-box protein [Burkholderiales bacterium]
MGDSEIYDKALADLGERVLNLDDPDEIAYAAAEILGRALGVSRAGYGSIDVANETIIIERDWNMPGVKSLAGTLQFRDYGSYIEDLKRGITVVIPDAETDARTAAGAAALKAISAQSFINMPVTEQGGFVALLYLNHAHAREWRDWEVRLVREVATRTRTAVARRRAEADLRAEQAELRETSERYRLAALATNDAIWDWRMADGHVVWNEALYELFGHKLPTTSAAWWLEHIHPDDRARVDHAIHAIIEGGGTGWNSEYRFRRADGAYAHVFDRGHVLRDEYGAPVRMIGAMLDLTERRRAEDRLRELNADLERQVAQRTLARGRMWQLTPDLMGVLGADGSFEASNPAWQTVLGWSEEDMTTLNWRDLVHPDDIGTSEAAWDNAARRGLPVIHFNNRYRTKTGEWRWLQWVAVPEDGKVYFTARDVTIAKNQADALTASTAELERLWRNSQDMLLVAGFDTKIIAVNPAWTTILGWREDELVGASFMKFIHPDDLTASNEEVTDLSAEGRTTMQFDNRYRAKDGSWIWLSWAVTSTAGQFHGVARDVSAEKARQVELELTQDALRQAQKMEAVGQLTGGIAHDFNNLLGGISGSLEMVERRYAEGRLEGVQRYIASAHDATRRAATLTQRLLAFSRRQTLDAKPIDVNKLIAGMDDLIRRAVGPAITVEVVGAGGLWPTKADASQLESALLNLCINARDAMAPDGGRLTIETANKWLDDRMGRERDLPPGQYVSLCVTDTGCGMPPEVIERAFDPFFTTKPIGQGTGLGLSMIYGFVRQSGGQVRVYSEVGQGTTMCVYLPRFTGKTEDEVAPELLDDVDPGDGQTVLVVDDEPVLRMLITDTLLDNGYQPLEAVDGATALKILESDVRIDLLITDVGLPGGMNGRQVADAARRKRPNLKVLFVTGYAENSVMGNGSLDAGMEVLSKPFPITTLAARIKSLIES